MRPGFHELGHIMKRITLLGMLAVLAGCGTGMVSSGGPDVGDDVDALSTVKAGFVTLTRDTRTCASPQCGGYWLSQPNHALAPIYVGDLDFSRSGLSDGAVAQVQSAPLGELVLYGTLTRTSRTTHTKNFNVVSAYRGLPGRAPAASDAFYTAVSNGRQCFAAPCLSFTATKINSTAKPKDFSSLSVASAAFAFVDQAWLSAQVLEGGALVSGTLQSGAHLAGGTEKILDATQVYLPVPQGPAACTQHQLYCPDGTAQVFERNASRCVVPTGCMAQGFCPQSVPACPEGYTRVSWRGDTTGCATFACDPSWTLE